MRAALAQETSKIGVHVAVLLEPYLSALLDGRKTMESRFGLTRQPPYECVRDGDIILLKRSGGPVVGVALAGQARFFELSPEIVEDLRNQYAKQLFADDDAFWLERVDKHYATLIEIEDATEVAAMSISKRDRRGWVSYTRAPCDLMAS